MALMQSGKPRWANLVMTSCGLLSHRNHSASSLQMSWYTSFTIVFTKWLAADCRLLGPADIQTAMVRGTLMLAACHSNEGANLFQLSVSMPQFILKFCYEGLSSHVPRTIHSHQLLLSSWHTCKHGLADGPKESHLPVSSSLGILLLAVALQQGL